MLIKRSLRKKALLAVAFAGGMLNPNLPVLSEGTTESTESAIQHILNDAHLAPEFRAFYLLRLANRYLADDDTAGAESSVRSFMSSSNESWLHRDSRIDNVLVSWADEVSPPERSTDKAELLSKSKKSIKLANAAIQQAILQLDKSSDIFLKLNMYFIASRLFRETGNVNLMRACNANLENAFQSCERSAKANQAEIKATSSVLNAMAFGILPVIIPDQNRSGIKWEPTTPLEVFTEKEFNESEKLKLRALALTDKLDSQEHLRRKAHRDLALWYLHLGKMKLAENQKQTLFDLIGPREDSLLFPRIEACGELAWWHTGKVMSNMDCGMG